MLVRRGKLSRILASVFIFALLLSIGVAGFAATKKTKVIIWGLNTTVPGGAQELAKQIKEKFSDIDLVPQVQVAGAGQTLESMQKLLTAIAAGNPPEITTIDRFVVGGWAARGALRPLDDLIERDKVDLSQWYPVCLDEAKFNGKAYAMSSGTDDRAMYYNRELMREAGMNPDAPPKTWDELMEAAKKLTVTDSRGNLKQIGFIPMFGNSWLYLYGWQNGGEFLSEDGKTATLNDPKIVEAIEWIVSVYDALGGAEKIQGFQASFQPGAQDPFLTGKVALMINGNWVLNNIARYRPDIDFAVAPAPVPKKRYLQEGEFKGKPQFITWSGGWAWAIPRGVKNVDAAWKVIKFMTGVEGHLAIAKGDYEYNKSLGNPYVPGMTSLKPADKALAEKYLPLLQRESLRKAYHVFSDLMKVSRYRPVTPVASELWTEHVRVVDLAIFHKMTPKEAADFCNANVQKALDTFWKSRK